MPGIIVFIMDPKSHARARKSIQSVWDATPTFAELAQAR